MQGSCSFIVFFSSRSLLDVSCFCADIYYMVPFIMVQHFVHSHYISVKGMNYALCDLYNTMCYLL